MPKSVFSALVFLLFGFLISCSSSESYTPKPRGFNRISLPDHAYQKLDGVYPYNFEVSKSAVVQIDTFSKAEPYWIILYYPAFNGRIQLTYKPVNGNMAKLQSHIDDAFKLASRHHVRATSQQDRVLKFDQGVTALTIDLTGEVSSHYQFYTTDSSKHFLRGATYLMEATMNDSLKPVVDYLKEDCNHLLKTLTWKK